MKLTILGSGTGLPRKDRNAPGYLVEVDNKLIMLDAGEGTKRQIVKAGYDLFKLSHIFITHTHVDHVSDIPAILWPFLWGTKKKNTLNIYGPPKFKRFYSLIIQAFLPTIKKKKNIAVRIKEVKNNKFKINNLTIETRLMPGRIQTHSLSPYEVGYRINYKNKSLAFCGDNAARDKEHIVKLAKDCSLLILEAAKLKSDVAHLGPETAGRIAAEVKAKKLLLTHFYPEVEKVNIKKLASKYYKGPIIIAKDLMNIKI